MLRDFLIQTPRWLTLVPVMTTGHPKIDVIIVCLIWYVTWLALKRQVRHDT
jgi:hypothetical protein